MADVSTDSRKYTKNASFRASQPSLRSQLFPRRQEPRSFMQVNALQFHLKVGLINSFSYHAWKITVSSGHGFLFILLLSVWFTWLVYMMFSK